MKLRISVVMVMLTVLILSACGPKIENAVDWPIKDFSVIDQNNKPFGLNDLKGKVWISDFIFTSCADVCPPMTSNLTKLQKMVKDKGLKDVEFVSFSVDPSVDSPESLTKYAKQFGIDFKNWSFLTGYSQEYIESFALKSFKSFVKKPQEGTQVMHQTYIYLVDQEGHVRKSYDGYKNVPFDEILNDIKALQ